MGRLVVSILAARRRGPARLRPLVMFVLLTAVCVPRVGHSVAASHVSGPGARPTGRLRAPLARPVASAGRSALPASPPPATSGTVVRAWGDDEFCELGASTCSFGWQDTPVQTAGVTDVVGVVGGGLGSSLALTADGTVWGWGYNGQGQLGDGTYDSSASPVQAIGLTHVVALAAGTDDTALAVEADGTVWSWGANGAGTLGTDSGAASTATPAQISTLAHVVAVAAGWYHNLAAEADGTVWAWGNDYYGALGSATGPCTARTPWVPCSAVPLQVAGLDGVVAVAAGMYFSVALKADGTVWAWGQDAWGQLGDGASTDSTTPVQVRGLTGVSAIAAGPDFALALKADGTVWGWGLNTNGRLGTNPTSNVPMQIPGIGDVVAIAAGADFSLALKADGTVWGWGADDSYQLGAADGQDHPSPIWVGQLSGAVAIGAGDSFGLAVIRPPDGGPPTSTLPPATTPNATDAPPTSTPRVPARETAIPVASATTLARPTDTTTPTASATATPTATAQPAPTPTIPPPTPTTTATATPSPASVSLTVAPPTAAVPSVAPPTRTAAPPVPAGATRRSDVRPTATRASGLAIPPPKGASASKRRSGVPLTVTVAPRTVVAGRWVDVVAHTGPRARVALLLQVATWRTVRTGRRGPHERVRRVALLRVAAGHGTANRRGYFARALHVTHKTARPVRATLIVTARMRQGDATRRIPVTIAPPPRDRTSAKRPGTGHRRVISSKGA